MRFHRTLALHLRINKKKPVVRRPEKEPEEGGMDGERTDAGTARLDLGLSQHRPIPAPPASMPFCQATCS